ncbi:LysR family transcriptional regulator [Oscillatoria sp. FACHB-1407]|uniref:LysR family transcriptional regulator n=1 Tax=Oscillatoria sp. FACHB-1407 TaxID=2692847 RepID=UPI001683B01E|nr:LysR family transcriptional regulator [Oscillatoria sp. FACHB-1407]MBD2459826.1 LysR family transcriptional regulator [Oscillatoria sp. FACHB-1407]
MRLEQLQAFLAVAETGSFQKAAQRCGLTQSTISRQIQSLETELEISLFHRGAQATLTLGGDRFLPRARKICQEWQNATQELTDLRTGKQPELCVAAIHALCAYHLPPVLQQFCQDYPEVQLRITALGSDRALKVLKDGLVDVAIVMHNRFLSNSPEMVVKVLYDEPIKVLMAANHPLAHFEAVPWEELAQYPQVVYKDGYGMQRIVQEQFTRRGLNFRSALELNTPDAFRGVVRQSEMITLLAESELVEAYADPTLTVRAIAADPNSSDTLTDPPLTRRIVLVTTRDRLEIPPIQHFHNLVLKLLVPQAGVALQG